MPISLGHIKRHYINLNGIKKTAIFTAYDTGLPQRRTFTDQ
jgi:hypothetical protein